MKAEFHQSCDERLRSKLYNTRECLSSECKVYSHQEEYSRSKMSSYSSLYPHESYCYLKSPRQTGKKKIEGTAVHHVSSPSSISSSWSSKTMSEPTAGSYSHQDQTLSDGIKNPEAHKASNASISDGQCDYFYKTLEIGTILNDRNHTSLNSFGEQQHQHDPCEDNHQRQEIQSCFSLHDISLTDLVEYSPMAGIANLRNTCYMNSALQCLFHTPVMARYFLTGTYKTQIRTNGSPMSGKLAEAFADTFLEVSSPPVPSRLSSKHITRTHTKLHNNTQRYHSGTVRLPAVAPHQLKSIIGNWASHLSGYHQEDAHEFLRFLLDGLAEDLNVKNRKRNNVNNTENDMNRCNNMIRDLPRRNSVAQPSIDTLYNDVVVDEEIMKTWSNDMKSNYWWSRHIKTNRSFITDVFCGQLTSTIVCKQCHNSSSCFDPFYDLSIAIPEIREMQSVTSLKKQRFNHASSMPSSQKLRRQGVTNNCGEKSDACVTLKDCFREFTDEEVLDGENMIYCASCQKKQTSAKRITIRRFPPILLVHLKRFSNTRSKNAKRVSFPLRGLDLSEFASKNHERELGKREKCHVAGKYDLYAVSNHIGSLSRGHYTAFCLDMLTDQWHSFDDSKVSPIDESSISSSGVPYLLFYKLQSSS
mmetsp:Transcript_26303/g.32252  ORF Transcript_26303/g.32252 Transcript_26303/m.32252 type:complete len:643 (+) Transcript_26303:73-2001(+)